MNIDDDFIFILTRAIIGRINRCVNIIFLCQSTSPSAYSIARVLAGRRIAPNLPIHTCMRT